MTYDGGDKLLDTNRDAVMMDWETPLMKRHAEAICAGGGDVLNVGFGMGIFDRCVREHPVVSHTIIEAHPDVHSYLIREGWGSLSNVRVEFGRWQDVVDAIITENDAFASVIFIHSTSSLVGSSLSSSGTRHTFTSRVHHAPSVTSSPSPAGPRPRPKPAR